MEQLRQQGVPQSRHVELDWVGASQGQVASMRGSPLSSVRLLQIEPAGGDHRPRAEQRARAAPAVRHGFQRDGAGRATGSPAVDTSEVVERPIDVVRAAASRHVMPPWVLPGSSWEVTRVIPSVNCH
jgi:hypothetical protein